MGILSITGVNGMNLHNSISRIDKTTAKKFREYYNSGSLDFEAMKNGGDTIEVSKAGNICAKMENLQKQINDKDFSGMNETEIFSYIENAYNREFPNFRANESLNTELYEKAALQRDEQLKKALNIQDSSSFDSKIIQIYKKIKGYEGMKPLEILEKINADYTDDGTHLGRAKILCEKVNTGLITKEESKTVIKSMQYDMEGLYCRTHNLARIEDGEPEQFGEWKARYYDGEFLSEKAALPPPQERRIEMLTSFGEYLVEIKPLIDDFMKLTEGKQANDLTQSKDKDDEEEKEKTMEKADADPTMIKGSETK